MPEHRHSLEVGCEESGIEAILKRERNGERDTKQETPFRHRSWELNEDP